MSTMENKRVKSPRDRGYLTLATILPIPLIREIETLVNKLGKTKSTWLREVCLAELERCKQKKGGI